MLTLIAKHFMLQIRNNKKRNNKKESTLISAINLDNYIVSRRYKTIQTWFCILHISFHRVCNPRKRSFCELQSQNIKRICIHPIKRIIVLYKFQ